MSAPLVTPASVEAAARVLADYSNSPQDWLRMVPAARAALEAGFPHLLSRKLAEEALEAVTGLDVAELVDVLEVVYAMVDLMGMSREGLERLRQEKVRTRGGFTGRIVWLGNEGSPDGQG